MKYLFLVLLFSVLLACGSGDPSGENGKGEDLVFTLDTVQVDSKGDILYLNSDLYYSVLDKNKKYLYNINQKTFSIEQINLDSLELTNIHLFEEEGPNGIADYMQSLEWLGEGRFLMSGYGKIGVFDTLGKKLSDVGPEEVPAFESGEEGGNVLNPVLLPGSVTSYAGIYLSPGPPEPMILLWDTEAQSYRKMDSPLFEKSRQYQSVFNDGTMTMYIGTRDYLKVENNKVIQGLGESSDLYILEHGEKDFRIRTFENGWIPREKKTVFPEEINDRGMLEELLKKSSAEIFYHPPVWDESRQVYFRFSHELEYPDNATTPPGRFIPESTGAKVYLTVYNSDFKILKETRVPALDKAPSRHFVKDGKIWIFENIADEMAFVRLEFDF